MESRKSWEEQVVDRSFPLRRYLGGDAVFLTEYEGRQAAIKIVPADEAQLKQWQTAAKLSHPNLLRLLQAGRCRLDGKKMIYAVMELAEEDLSQVLPERALTAQEAREMLGPALGALAFLHSQGLVHGRLKPSNILALGDQLKLSSDHVAEGASADDVKALGATLVEALTQRRPMWPHLPETLEQPFRDIAEHTLHPDPKKRWTLAQITARLEGASPKARGPIRWQYLLPVGAAALAVLIFAWRSGGSRTEAPPSPVAKSEPVAKPEPTPVAKPMVVERAAVDPKPEPAPKTESKPEPARETKASPPIETPEPDIKPQISSEKVAGVEQEVLPQIPRKAAGTIHGTMVVNVRVQVDSSGTVSGVKLEPPAASRYFAKYILDAAKQWKFGTSDRNQEWTLRFVFTRKDMKVLPRRVS